MIFGFWGFNQQIKKEEEGGNVFSEEIEVVVLWNFVGKNKWGDSENWIFFWMLFL